jgi:hypothetical protein
VARNLGSRTLARKSAAPAAEFILGSSDTVAVAGDELGAARQDQFEIADAEAVVRGRALRLAVERVQVAESTLGLLPNGEFGVGSGTEPWHSATEFLPQQRPSASLD